MDWTFHHRQGLKSFTLTEAIPVARPVPPGKPICFSAEPGGSNLSEKEG
jgi:hypothetical protein